jgi:lysophospholipase L1-like esterase
LSNDAGSARWAAPRRQCCAPQGPSPSSPGPGRLLAAEASVLLDNLPKDTCLLFQGDSITDGNRGRNQDPNHILGHGYVFLIGARNGAALPEKNLTFLNRGISGNTVQELARRWRQDTLDLQPDLLSILIGVNDAGLGRRASHLCGASAHGR